ncbi:BTAD domain-containing putative transcriptional regulator [Streptomyces bacillaris]|uniref:BTAD domain-containing putative transcriptional regulator n=1 Tax=Streptomyces bacillaris TaxID=68179 RepID=UPI00345FB1DE
MSGWAGSPSRVGSGPGLFRQERFLTGMEVPAEVELQLGRHRHAVPLLHYAVHEYPPRERFAGCSCSRSTARAGTAKPLVVYAQHRARLVAEPGSEPGPLCAPSTPGSSPRTRS